MAEIRYIGTGATVREVLQAGLDAPPGEVQCAVVIYRGADGHERYNLATDSGSLWAIIGGLSLVMARLVDSARQ